jgi:hypothetical protein
MDKMSRYLENEVAAYSSVNRTRCFNHILNLTGKALLRQFDVKKTGDGDDSGDSDQVLSAEEKELLNLAEGIEDEELAMAQEHETGGQEDGAGNEELDELDKWVDEVSNEMTEEEQVVLAVNIRPVSRVLVKVRHNQTITYLTYKVSSCANLPLPWSILQHSSCLRGSCVLRSWSWQFGLCLGTSQHVGTPPMTCSALPLHIEKQSNMLPQT